ncbi:MAG TPA: neuraminidase-like domain-containing protein [Pyrinomonadaceae bacterium]|nr:neuraminidase-like domain-containing protein [Pyrinomonadaceae bacterium]
MNRNSLSSPADLRKLGSSPAPLDWGSLKQDEATQDLKAHARLYNVSRNIDVSQQLLQRGLMSASQIALMPQREFVSQHAGALNLSEEQAAQLHQRATVVQNKAMHLAAAIHSSVGSPHFQSMLVSNVGDDVVDHFEDLPSYQEMFGGLNYCECAECKSIFGAAAYFVDLMRIIDTYVTSPTGNKIPDPFKLEKRRPDLAQIPLTCEMTNNLVPYLRIINERLSDTAISNLGIGSGNPNQKKQDYNTLAQKMATGLRYPLLLPFHYPLDQIRTLLKQLGISLQDIFAAWGVDVPQVVRESLSLSLEQAAIIATPATDAATVAAFYDMTEADVPGKLSDLSMFTKKAELTVPQVQDLVVQGLSDDEIAAKVPANLFINRGLGDNFLLLLESQQGAGSIKNLTNQALDQMNRLRRLADAVGWSAPDTDWVLSQLIKPGVPTKIDDAAFATILQVRNLAETFQLTPVQAAVFFGPIKTYGDRDENSSTLFDQLFNDPATVAKSGAYHPAGNALNSLYKDTPPLKWLPGSDQDTAAIMRVAPGLGLKLDALTALGKSLFAAQVKQSAQLNLDVDTLSILYRHALLSRGLSLRMEQYLILLDLLGLTGTQVFKVADLNRVLTFRNWMTAAGLNVYQLQYILKGTTSVYVNQVLNENQIVPWLASLIKAVTATSPDPEVEVDAQLAVFFGIDQTLLTVVRTMALKATTLPAGLKVWTDAFLAPFTEKTAPPYLAYVKGVLGAIAQWLAFAQAAQLSADLLACVSRNATSFGLQFSTLTIDNLRDIQQLSDLIQQFGDKRGDLLAYIDASAQDPAAPAALSALQSATGWPQEQVSDLLNHELKGISNVMERLRRLSACFVQIAMLGGDVTFLRGLVGLAKTPATTWDTYQAQVALVLAKVSERFGQANWTAMSAQVESKLEVRRRDALVGIVMAQLRSKYKDIQSPDNVYEFLLIDVEVGPEMQISYIKEALNAAQLYLQRCRLRLEPGVNVLDIPEVWWEWILNYRVWEANRQIFLYPENYLLPSVRRDKTSLFVALENELLQSEVTTDTVETAYTTFIENLCSLTDMKVVETWYGEINHPQYGRINALYLFARSMTAPYTFHMCRQIDKEPWSEWEKIDLAISSPYVSPVYAFGKLFLFWVRVEKLSSPSIEVGTQGGKSYTNVSHRATIQYSFQNRAGKWVQPQTLTQGEVVYFDDQGQDASLAKLKSHPLFEGVFEMDNLVWHKVYPVRITADNLPAGLSTGKDPERIAVFYGPMLANAAPDPSLLNLTPPKNVDALAFFQQMVSRMKDMYEMLAANNSGLLPFCPVLVLNSSLQTSVIVHKPETLLMDTYRPATLAQFRPVINDLQSSVQLVPSGTPIADNYLGDMPELSDIPSQPQTLSSLDFINSSIKADTATKLFQTLQAQKIVDGNGTVIPSSLPSLNLYLSLREFLEHLLHPFQLLAIQRVLLANAGSPILFGAVEHNKAAITTVKNQPGWFMLDNGDESFLLQPVVVKGQPPAFSSFPAGLTVSTPPFHPASFIIWNPIDPASKPVIDHSVSSMVFKDLQTYKLLTQTGLPVIPTIEGLSADDLATVVLANYINNKQLTKAQVKAIRHALLNYPLIFEDDFVSPSITPALSEQIYKSYLQQYSLVDQSKRLAQELLSGDTLKTVLGLLVGTQLMPKDVTAIYRTLVEAPIPVALNYFNAGTPGDFLNTGQFTVTRLTTAATPLLERALFTGGIERLLSLETQNVPVKPLLPFDRLQPTARRVVYPDAIDGAEVDFDGLYGQYFWELFFHGPMLVASSLAANQQFRDATAWFHYVFDPTLQEQFVTADTFANETEQTIDKPLSADTFKKLQEQKLGDSTDAYLSPEGRVNPSFDAQTDLSFLLSSSMTADLIPLVRNVLLNYKLATSASRFWNFRPFRTHTLEELETMLADDNPAVQAYNNNPFDPFAIARLRISAFEKATVMQYVDTLIQWGDFYFTQDTWESITAATMLYVYAFDLLGPRPQSVGTCSTQPPATYDDIRKKYAAGHVPQFLIDLETSLPSVSDNTNNVVPIQAHGFNDLNTYFGVPENAQFITYWDRVDDRLNKIRHSMNIKGQVRTLALFEPPLDPMALIRAAGASNNFMPGTAAASPAVPPQRFRYVLERAKNLTATATQLGTEIMYALEKKDMEAMVLLRSTQEQQMLALITQVKQQQIDELQFTVASMNASLSGAQSRLDHYNMLIKDGLSSPEQTNIQAMEAAMAFNLASSILQTASSIGYAIPQAGSPFAMTYGGIQIGSAVQAAAGVAQMGAEISTYIGQRALTMAEYGRREQEWNLQKAIAQADVDSLTQQISAAQTQLDIAKHELALHVKTIAQTKEMDDFLRAKFSSQELYQWMIGRLSSLYFQTYRVAMEAATSAQTAYQFELDVNDIFLDFDYWDSLRKGLLAGEGLKLALDRMEAAYANSYQRRLEIERTISLAELDPNAIDSLKTKGVCQFDLPEILFDYDFPGHYLRKIKSLSLSIPAVVGPYQNIKATLTQTKNAIATASTLDVVTYLMAPQNGDAPTGVRTNWAPTQQIAVSRGIDDSGLFQLDFNDERYLPFEGTGAVSSWTLEMPVETNRFDFSQLSDVIINLRYTAKEDSELKKQVRGKLKSSPLRTGYYLDMQQSYPVEWQSFMQNHTDKQFQSLSFAFTPTWMGALKELTLLKVMVRLSADASINWPVLVKNIGTLTIAGGQAQTLDLQSGVATLDNLSLTRAQFTGEWVLSLNLQTIGSNTVSPSIKGLLSGDWLDPAKLRDIELILICNASVF